MKNAHARILAATLAITAVVTAVLLSNEPLLGQDHSEPQAIQEPASSEATIANCRYGTTTTLDPQTSVINGIGAGWYLDFDFKSPPPSLEPANGAEFVHMVRLKENFTRIANNCDCPDDYRFFGTYRIVDPPGGLDQAFASFLKTNPGKKIIIGNEVDRFGAQDGLHPEVYADAYHDIYHFIKSHDPTAQVGISGLVQFTPNRERYLEAVWKAYIHRHGTYMPVDFWTLHVYILPELNADGSFTNTFASSALGVDRSNGKRASGGDPARCSDPDVYCVAEHDDMGIFAEQIVAMRQWMKRHGQQNKPLMLTEYSLLYPYRLPPEYQDCYLDEFGECFTPASAANFMLETFNYLKTARDPDLGYPLDDNRLIQQSIWFSVYNRDLGNASNLAQANLTTLTQVGNQFRNYVFGETPFANLIVDDVADVSVATNGAATATARLEVTFRNKGNTAVDKPFKVTFYRDANRSVTIGSVTIDPAIYGCSSHAYTASVEWSGLPKGTHRYYALIDSDDVIQESPSGNVDNMGMGTVRVYTNRVSLPIIRGG